MHVGMHVLLSGCMSSVLVFLYTYRDAGSSNYNHHVLLSAV